MASLLAFATDKVLRKERTAYWREHAWKDLGEFDVSGGENGFDAAVEIRCLGELKVARVQAQSHRISRSAVQAKGDDRRVFKIVLPHNGEVFIEQRDQRIVLKPGLWGMYDSSRPFSFTCSDDTKQTALFVRAEDLHLNDLTPYAMKVFSGTSGYGSLLKQVVSTAAVESNEYCPDGDISLVLARLARLAILENGSRESRRTSSEVMRERIDGYLETHLRRSDLTIDTVARGLNCSKRYLHKVFIGSDQTLSEYILQRRLEACRQDLIDPASPHPTVTDVAYAWGFSSLAYFSRVFKQTYGMSPRQYRVCNGGIDEMATAN